MKSYKIYPSKQLENYIDHYWWIETTDRDIESKTERVLADPSLEIIFHFSTPVSRINDKGILEKEPTVLLIGQTLKPYTILSTQNTMMLGVKFHSHTAKYFFDIQPQEMKDKYFDLSDLWKNDVNILYEQLAETVLLESKIEIMECYLLKIKSKKAKVGLQIENIIKKMFTQKGQISIKEICSINNFTPRHLEKLFQHNVGLSPKLLSRIFQFQNTLKLLKNNSESLTQLGLEAGYFDQSHFIKTFIGFAGCTPSQYIKEQFPLQDLINSSN